MVFKHVGVVLLVGLYGYLMIVEVKELNLRESKFMNLQFWENQIIFV